MRFWDSSAIVPLLVAQPASDTVGRLLRLDPEAIIWWSTPIECAAALARLEREGSLSPKQTNVSLERLRRLAQTFDEVQPTDRVRCTALRLLRSHRLRAADSLQLAAAIEASAGHPNVLPFVCLDERLADAALREGLDVVGG
jgi:uncharacterized protein